MSLVERIKVFTTRLKKEETDGAHFYFTESKVLIDIAVRDKNELLLKLTPELIFRKPRRITAINALVYIVYKDDKVVNSDLQAAPNMGKFLRLTSFSPRNFEWQDIEMNEENRERKVINSGFATYPSDVFLQNFVFRIFNLDNCISVNCAFASNYSSIWKSSFPLTLPSNQIIELSKNQRNLKDIRSLIGDVGLVLSDKKAF